MRTCLIPLWLLLSCHLLFADSPSILNQYYKADTCKPDILFNGKSTDKATGVSQYNLTFHSLCWPTRDNLWQHRLTLYVPKSINHATALFFVCGGINHIPESLKPLNVHDKSSVDNNLIQVADSTSALVVELSDIPNQYITFEPGKPVKENGITAYAWLQVLNGGNAFWAPHLPMAKATSLAMDAVSKITKSQGLTTPRDYVITGLSKRGWAAWLTLLEDPRVTAILPGVAGFLDTKQMITHVRKSLGNWPEAFYNFQQLGITEHINTRQFDDLMQIEDPWQYRSKPVYQSRFHVPKFHVISSGDDFLAPDAQNHLLVRMPGVNYFRVLPNQTHYIDIRPYMASVIVFYRHLVGDIVLPQLTWTQKNNRLETVTVNQPPVKATLWYAHNPDTRDFRFRKGIRYQAKPLSAHCDDTAACQINLPVSGKKPPGYEAQFVELVFTDNIVLTTPVFITPDTYPKLGR